VSENHEAQALARWLEEHPGQAPPPDVDPEVIEALYALRPDLAPPPDVRIEDIFAAVESGPFHTAHATTADEEEVTEEVVSLAAERAKRVPNEVAPASQPPVRRASWWSAPGAGALAAAALALVVILPAAGILLTQRNAEFETSAAPAAPAPAPAQDAGADALATPSLQAAPEAVVPLPAEPPERRDSNELFREEAKKSDKMEDDRAAVGAVAGPADAAKPAASAGERAAEPANTVAADDFEEQAALEKSQPEAKLKSEEAAPAKELESYDTLAAGASTSATRSRAKDYAAPAAPSSVAAAEAPATLADESSTPGPYGDISAASTDAALAAATDDSDDRKAMTAAWFLAQRQYERGDPDAAMATIAKGLRRVGNDDLRSDLTALQWTVAQSTGSAAPATDP
jgi:hypothetical protein